VFAGGRKCEIAGDAQCAVKYTRAEASDVSFGEEERFSPSYFSSAASFEDADRIRVLAISRSFSGRLRIVLIAPVLQSFTSGASSLRGPRT